MSEEKNPTAQERGIILNGTVGIEEEKEAKDDSKKKRRRDKVSD